MPTPENLVLTLEQTSDGSFNESGELISVTRLSAATRVSSGYFNPNTHTLLGLLLHFTYLISSFAMLGKTSLVATLLDQSTLLNSIQTCVRVFVCVCVCVCVCV